MDIARACADSNVRKFIHISSAVASPESKSAIMKSRADGVEMLKKEFPDSIIVRSASLYGFEDRFLRAIGGKNMVVD